MIYRDEFGEISDARRLSTHGYETDKRRWSAVHLELRSGDVWWLGSHLANVEVLPDSGEPQTAKAEQSSETWECPMCGALGGEPVEWDFGIDPQTGYHDAGIGCTQCVGNGAGQLRPKGGR